METYYFRQICGLLRSILSANLYKTIETYIKSEFKVNDLKSIIGHVVSKQSFYDREIRCIFSTMFILAETEVNNC